MTRLHALDLLRFIAAAIVMLAHFSISPAKEGTAPLIYMLDWTRYGSFGVELFFLISGFVILMTAQGASLRDFVVARIVRLYPAFWICTTITFLVAATEPLGPTVTDFLGNMTMLPRVVGVGFISPPYWTLTVELQFYLAIALLILTGSLRRIEPFLWIWLLVAFLASAKTTRALFVSDYACYFVGGCACYLLRERVTAARVSLFIAAWLSALHFSRDRAHVFEAANNMAYNPIVVAVLITVFFALILAISRGWVRVPAWRGIVMLGAMSYPLYLLHHRVGTIIFIWGFDTIPDAALYWGTVVWMLAVSWAVVRWGEVPVQRWMRKKLAPGETHNDLASMVARPDRRNWTPPKPLPPTPRPSGPR